MTSSFVTLLLVITARDLVTFEGVIASSAAKQTPLTPRYQMSDSGSQDGGDTVEDFREKDHQDPPAGGPTRLENLKDPQKGLHADAEPGAAGNNVDTILAALVDYSKDPKLWRFVHSVVDELDYSQRASSHLPATRPPHHQPRPPIHLTRLPNTHRGTSYTGGNNDTDQSDRRNASHPRNTADKRTTTITTTTTTTTTVTPHLPWLQQPPEQPYTGSQTTATHTYAPRQGTDRVNFIKTPPSPSSHFYFHKVFLDKIFDNRTRQSYRRPILALTARDIATAKTLADGKSNVTDTANTAEPLDQNIGVSKEFTDRIHSLSVKQRIPNELKQDGEVRQESGNRYGGDSGESENRNILSDTHHHHHYHRHRLHTFKSQLKYLQRWEDKLWRRVHLQPHHHESRGP